MAKIEGVQQDQKKHSKVQSDVHGTLEFFAKAADDVHFPGFFQEIAKGSHFVLRSLETACANLLVLLLLQLAISRSYFYHLRLSLKLC